MDEVLRRIDKHLARSNEHMARGNEHMARGNEHMARGNELMEEVREEFRLNREAHELYKLALAQMMDENRSAFRGMVDELNEMRAEIRAGTEAIFKLIDRMDDGAATA